jgi:hypothetical protein
MTSAKTVILTTIAKRGIEYAKNNAAQIADGALCSKQHVLRIIRDVEAKKIVIR